MHIILTLLLLTTGVFASQEIDQPIERIFVPVGFDNNDSIQIVASGRFKNSCFQLGPYHTLVDNGKKEIEIRVIAYEYGTRCLQVESPFFHVIHLGRLPKPGDYTFIDGATGKKIGALAIKKSEDTGSGTDDDTYAPLLDAYLTQAQFGSQKLHLKGIFTDSCLHIKEVSVKTYGDVVVVQPFMERREGENCKKEDRPFHTTTVIKEELPATFLLHVRSLGGQAINKVVYNGVRTERLR